MQMLLVEDGLDLADLAAHVPFGDPAKNWEENIKVKHLPIEQRKWLTINRCLNYWEALAIAIKNETVDDQTVKDFVGPVLAGTVVKLYPFISAVRNNNVVGSDDTWRPLQDLAEKWGATFPPPQPQGTPQEEDAHSAKNAPPSSA